MEELARQSSGPAARQPLLAAKMSVPQLRTPVVARSRLLEQASGGVEGPLTVVSAAAGAGKSVLAASWIAAGLAPGPVAWLTLDRFDDDPGVFWAYVVATLRRHGVELPDAVGEPIQADDVDRSFLARLADALAAQPRPVVLVLDEFEYITQRVIVQELTLVLRSAAPALRLLILTRNATLVALHRYRLTGEVAQLDGADLAFTPDEAAVLLRQHGVRLSADALASLTAYTGGWAAGLRLSAVAMQRRVDPNAFVAALPATDTAMAAYLADEVLDSQRAEIREFLLRTSVADRVCPGLGDALTGRTDSRAVLDALQTANVLTEEIKDAPGWYRYHPLFTHVLRAELSRQRPELVTGLHRVASVWFDRSGLRREAVSHAVAAEDWRLASWLIVRRLGVGEFLVGRDTSRLANLFAPMPADQPGAMPAVVQAACAMARFDVRSGRARLDVAEERVNGEAPEDRGAALACIAVLRTVLARATADVQAAERARGEADAHLRDLAEEAAEHPELSALMLSSVGSVQLWAGRFEEAEQTLRTGLAVSRQPGSEYPRTNMLGRVGWIQYHKGHLRDAAQLGQEALQLAETVGLPVRHRTGAGHLTLAMVALEWNDRAGARRHLDNVEKSAGARYDPFVATVAPLLRALQHAHTRDYRRAFAALARVPSTVVDAPLPAWLATRVALTHAGVHLHRGDTAAAAAALERAEDRGAEWAVGRSAVALAAGDRSGALDLLSGVLAGQPPPAGASTVEAWLLMARIRADEGSPRAARDALIRALEAARPEGHRRAFADAGPWLRTLLRSHPDLAQRHQWLGPPLVERAPAPRATAPRGAAPRSPTASPEPLTSRERTVLARMAQAMSVEDIAVDLFLSVNTIKTHQKSIYRKLSVARRNEAVRRARELRLI